MTNLAITSACNRNCEYCFAGSQPESIHMTKSVFARLLKWLKTSGIDQVRLLGGEPTLHPNFRDFVENATSNGFNVLVFSNGLIEKEMLYWLADRDDNQIKFLININPLEKQSEEELEKIFYSLRYISSKSSLGFNISSASSLPDFLLPLIDRYGLKRVVRLGMAHPCLDESNQFLPVKFYKSIGKKLVPFIEKTGKKEIDIEFDCGFVPCMFPEHLFSSGILKAEDFSKGCGPIPDILPNGNAIHCYPLRSLGEIVDIFQTRRAQDIREQLTRSLSLPRESGIFPDCSSCNYRKVGKCLGGCLSSTILRFSNNKSVFNILAREKKVKVGGGMLKTKENHTEEHENREKKRKCWVIPYIDQPVSFWDELYEKFGEHILEVYLPCDSSSIGSGRPIQPEKHLTSFLENSPFAISLLANPIVLPFSVETVAAPLLASIEKKFFRANIRGITVTDLNLAAFLKREMQHLIVTASTLMDVYTSSQVQFLNGVCDVLVPSSRIMRDITSLRKLKDAFNGEIRLMLNESCIPNCPFRTQHFYEMNTVSNSESLCNGMLEDKKWLRLTGSWVLPQHLKYYDGLWDNLKLSGRVTLQDPAKYLNVISSYINGLPLTPDAIGGGPASVLSAMSIEDQFFCKTLQCVKNCHECTECQDYFEKVSRRRD